MENVVDQLARDGVNIALAKIDAHEKICLERAMAAADSRKRTEEGINDIKKGVEGLYDRIWHISIGVGSTVILLLLSALGVLVLKAFVFK